MSIPNKRQRHIQFCGVCNQPTSCPMQACWKLVKNMLKQNMQKVRAKHCCCTGQQQLRKINADRDTRRRLPLVSASALKSKYKRPVGRPRKHYKLTCQIKLNDGTPKVVAIDHDIMPRTQHRVPKVNKISGHRCIGHCLPVGSVCTLTSQNKRPVGRPRKEYSLTGQNMLSDNSLKVGAQHGYDTRQKQHIMPKFGKINNYRGTKRRCRSPKNVEKKEMDEIVTREQVSEEWLPTEQMTGPESTNQRPTLLPEGEPNCFESITILDTNYADDHGASF